MRKTAARILCILLALVLTAGLLPTAGAYSAASWAEETVHAMDTLGLIPDSLADADLTKVIPRVDMCRIAMLTYTKLTDETVEVPTEHPFTDTTDPDVERAYAVGLVKGDGTGEFRPDDSLTRAEFFCFVSQFLESIGYPADEGDYASLEQFSDGAEIPSWAASSAQLTVGLGIVNGTGSALNWAGTTSAQEALVMFYRTYLVVIDSHEYANLASWAEEAVVALDTLGLIPNEVVFGDMAGPISRRDTCELIMRSYKLLMDIDDGDLGDPGESPFSDTEDLDVLNAYNLGIVTGRSDGTFGPGDPITRQDFFVITVRFLNAIGYPNTDDTSISLDDYTDGSSVSSYAQAATRLLIGTDCVTGTDTKALNPRTNIVCQESLVIFHRVYNFYQDWTADPGEEEESSDLGQQVVDLAMEYLGCGYAAGGKSPDEGFDCSGFVYYIYKQFGYTLNPGATNQWNALSHIIESQDELIPGDLVFFSESGDDTGICHVGIYIGDGQFIHANTPSTGVIISKLSENYYATRYLAGKRVIE